MKKIISILLSSLIFCLLAGTAAAQTSMNAPAMTKDGILVTHGGMTLYTFAKDTATPGKSACNGQCTQNWPPLLAQPGEQPSGNWSQITRNDKQKQWAYKNQPLYLWSKDREPGDQTGEGMGSAWHVAKP